MAAPHREAFDRASNAQSAAFAVGLGHVYNAFVNCLKPSYAVGDLLFASNATEFERLAGNTAATTKVLTQTGNGTISAAPSWGDFNELAQDAVGGILADTSTIDFTYADATPSITADVKDDSITDAKLRNSGACSVIGRSANSTGDPADIASSADGQVLRRAGGALAFGAVDLADGDAVTGALSFANGGTNDTGGAWTAYTPTVTASSGTFTSVGATGQYKRVLGKLYMLRVVVTITTNGTAAGRLLFTTPVNVIAAGGGVAGGWRGGGIGVIGLAGFDSLSTFSVTHTDASGTYPGSNGAVIRMAGFFEAA
jgi:hypothetical protein